MVYLDVDVTIRPDSSALGLVPLLISGHASASIFVRDSWPGTECAWTARALPALTEV